MAGRAYLALVVAIAALGLGALVASAAPVPVYSGSGQVTGWGGGKAEISRATKYEESSAIEIETKGYYEGGFLKLATPIDLAEHVKSGAGSSMVVMVRITAAQATRGQGRRGRTGRGRRGDATGPGMPAQNVGLADAAEDPNLIYAQMPGMPGMPGMGAPEGMGMPGMGMPGMPGMGAPEGMGMPGMGMPGMGMPGMGMPGMGMPGMGGGEGMGMPGMPGMGMPGMGGAEGMGMPGMGGTTGRRGGRTWQQRTLRPPKPLEAVRVVLLTDEGQMDGGSYLVSKLQKKGDWSEVKIPFNKFKGPGAKKATKLLGVIFTGDSVGKVFVGHAEIQGS